MVSTAYQGFCPFRRYNRIVHWVGYLSIVSVYVGSYLLVASALPGGGRLSIALAVVVAGCLLGLYAGWLYGNAVGSPYGNVLLSLITPVFTPGLVYAIPFPGTTLFPGTFHHPELVAGSLVGLFAALWSLRRSYAAMEDIVGWEREVLPHGFRVVDDEWLAERPPAGAGRSSRGPQLKPRSEQRLEPRLDVWGWLASLFVVVPALALAAAGADTYGDQAFSGIMLIAVLVMLHWGLRVEER